ncbi:hypothetical protein ACHQM5_014915 [Ranunculus cassubicifolius]
METQSTNNDTLVEVLSWLPAETLLRFETVSKGWHNIISDDIFQRVQCQRAKAKPKISGFFFQNLFDSPKEVKYISLSSNRAIAHPKVLDFLAAKVDLAASSNGLLCCHTEQNFHPSRANRVKFVYVCNPATKKFVQIEWPKGTNRHLTFGLAFDPSCTPVDDLPNFKLVCVSNEDTSHFLFQVYSSKTTEWRTLKTCKYSQSWCGMPHDQVVFASGVLYWIVQGSGILAFHVETELSYFISFPVPWEHKSHQGIHENGIGESKGQLHYILISEVGIGLWRLSSEFKWELERFMSLSAMEEEFPYFLYNEAKEAAGLVPSDWLTPKWIEPLFLHDDILLLKLRCSFSYEMIMLKTAPRSTSITLAPRCWRNYAPLKSWTPTISS